MVAGASGDQADTQGRESDEDERREQSEGGPVSPWEWAVAAVGLVLVVGTIGFMLYQAIAGGDTPPLIKVEVTDIQPVGDGFLVTFTATNEGDEAAADVVIEGELQGGAGGVETSTATISYVPGGSRRQGGLYFSGDPRGEQLRLRARGFELP